MSYIGWANNVSKVILSSTNITVGENATVQDSIESGGAKKSRLACSNPSDKYAVTMAFSFAEESKDEYGLTEIDRFWAWYKWKHQYGVNPFKFPAILLNTNRQKGYSLEERTYEANRLNNQLERADITEDMIPNHEFYRITSAVNATTEGTDQKVTMTWENYATGTIVVPDETAYLMRISATNGYVDLIFSDTPETEPISENYTLYIDTVATVVSKSSFDGDKTLRMYFTPLTDTGTHTAQVNALSDTFVVTE